jgi:hypothetical protein
MDLLLQKFGLKIITPKEITFPTDRKFEETADLLKEVVLINNEKILILRIKNWNEITQENFVKLNTWQINQVGKFMELKYLFIKNDKELFFTYESEQFTLMEYFKRNEVNIKTRFFLYKQAIEIIQLLKYMNFSFNYFNHNFFFLKLQEENKSLSSSLMTTNVNNPNNNFSNLPIMKFLYHGKIYKIILNFF